MKIFFSITSVFALSIFCLMPLAKAQPPCDGLLGQVPVIHHGQPATHVSFVEDIDRAVKSTSSPVVLGEVLRIAMFHDLYTPVYVKHSILNDMRLHVQDRVRLWKLGVFDEHYALSYVSLDDLVQIRQVTSQAEFEDIVAQEFLRINSITDTTSGLYAPPHSSSSKFGVKFKINRETGELESIDLGSLTKGLYSLDFTIWVDGKIKSKRYIVRVEI